MPGSTAFPVPGAYPDVPEPPSPFSDRASNSSYATWASSSYSSHPISASPLASHWATELFSATRPSTRFPRRIRGPSKVVAEPVHKVAEMLARSGCHFLARMMFEAAEIDARFYTDANGRDVRLILFTVDQQKRPTAVCSLLKRLKMVRDGAYLEFYRQHKEGNYLLWARLCFVDIESLSLFYSTAVALKTQDMSADEGHRSGMDKWPKVEEQLFGGYVV
jgi:hypothetical protein